jgi:hypothetical protein
MRVSKLRHAVLCCVNRRHSLKLRRVRITEQFRLLGIEFNVILKVPVGIQYNITVVAPSSKTFSNPRFTIELTMT